jgi:hypothetical protein
MKGIKIFAVLLAIIVLHSCEKDNSNNVVIKLYGDAYSDIAYSIAEYEGDTYIAGLRTVITRRDGNYIESSDINAGLIRAAGTGSQKWELTPGSVQHDQASKVIVTAAGDIVFAGFTTRGTGTGSHTDIYIVKATGNGSVLWESVIGGSGNQAAFDIISKPGGGYMVAGTTDAYRAESGSFTENIAGMKDFFLLEVGENGDSITSYAFGYGGNDICKAIKRDIGGGYVLYGTTDNSTEPGLDKNNILLIRLNDDASIRGAAIIGDLDDEYAADFEVLSNGYLLASTIGKENEANQIRIIKLSSNIQATPIFTRKFNVNGLPSAVNTISRGTGGVFYLGGRLGSPTSSEMLIVKIDDDGATIGMPFISGGTGSQEIFDLMISSDGYVMAAGKTGYENNTMMCLIKYRD